MQGLTAHPPMLEQLLLRHYGDATAHGDVSPGATVTENGGVAR